ncbi:hypothetical protein [uncultured Tenacibaculum sp.]|uniref:hypothetical protein n=1 Tax=uncultured Tenacibaculum sp. TaxID=174713 RepID=UPI0026216405|nr:hypothetical protein [uncultured Tenacibaculum sp.]
MKNSYDQLNIEYVETKNVSPFIKFITIILILTFVIIPLPELIDTLEYNHAAPQTIHTCFVGWSYEPLQFKSFALSN